MYSILYNNGKHRAGDDAVTVDIDAPLRRAMHVRRLINVKAIGVDGTKHQRFQLTKRSKGELQSRQIFSDLSGERRTELIEVRMAALNSIDETSNRRRASRGGRLALKSCKARGFNVLGAGRIDPRHA